MIKVAKQERKSQGAGNQPITRHPLFPAIAALWVAALFGLGSMVLSPATIERLVGATGLSSLVPMAAPPLGVTARLLVALALTGLGALVGVVIGLRLARRGSGEGNALADTSTETAAETEDATPVIAATPIAVPGRLASLAGRRRGPETVREAEPAPTPASLANDMTAPQILQLAEFDLDGLPAQVEDDADDTDYQALPAEPAAPRVPDLEDTDVAQVDAATVPLGDQGPEAEAPLTGPAPSQTDAIETPAALAPAFSSTAFSPAAFSPAAWADSGHDGDDQANFTPLSAPLTAAPLFETYLHSETAPHDTLAREAEPQDTAFPEPEPEPSTTPTPTPTPDQTLTASAAERISRAPLDALSQVELLERLALAMEEQRRKLSLTPPAPLTVVAPAIADAPPADREGLAADPLAGITAPKVPTATDSAADGRPANGIAPDDAPSDPTPPYGPSVARLAAISAAMGLGTNLDAGLDGGLPQSPAAAPFAPPPFARTPFSGPGLAARTEVLAGRIEAAQPLEDDFALGDAPEAAAGVGGWQAVTGGEAEAELETYAAEIADGGSLLGEAADDAASSVVSPLFPSARITPIPAKLRPIGLASFDEQDEDDVLPGYIPPRHIALAPQPVATPVEAAIPTPVEAAIASALEERPMAGLAAGHDFVPAPAEDEDEEEGTALAFGEDEDFAEDGADIVEEDVLEEGYSSLLSMQRRIEPRPGFIALDDESENEGENGAGHPGPRPAEAVNETATATTATHIDAAPAFMAPAQPGARLFDPPGRPDPAETEKALRAALATLQRMSGSH
ncbi:hypothetical protein CA833_07380 [Novosphingobium sp. KA1]|nr:hypothetical protein CA833_07380 [Novosphingobium sp. KA1]